MKKMMRGNRVLFQLKNSLKNKYLNPIHTRRLNSHETEELTHLQRFTFKPHINFQHIAQNEQLYSENVKNRCISDVNIREIVSQYEKYIELLTLTNEIRNFRRLIADYIAGKINPAELPQDVLNFALKEYAGTNVEQEWARLQSLRKYPDSRKHSNGIMSAEEKDIWVRKGKELKERCAELEPQLAQAYNHLLKISSKLPNLTHPQTPIGDEPAVLDIVGSKEEIIAHKKKIYDSFDICLKLDLADFDRASTIASSKFYYLKNEAVLLEFALINYALSKLMKYGFTLTTTPELVRRDVIEACGFQPRGEHSQIYNIQDSELCLTGTSEIALAGMFADKIIENFEPLPQKIAAVSHCFRTEAGALGRRDKGLYRVHQFTKVEMFALTAEDQSEDMLKHLVSVQKEIYTDLGLHFKVLNMPSTDLGAPAYNKIDIEAYMPGKDMYGELTSASNCTDYQSRRLGIRMRAVDPNTRQQYNAYVHTLNATAIAIPRTIIAILETYQFQDENGLLGVKIPEVLHPYMHGIKVIMEKKNESKEH
jgi:seryl-tRNA synthetase